MYATDDGTVRFCAAVPESTVGEWVDVGHDVGIFVRGMYVTPLGPNWNR